MLFRTSLSVFVSLLLLLLVLHVHLELVELRQGGVAKEGPEALKRSRGRDGMGRSGLSQPALEAGHQVRAALLTRVGAYPDVTVDSST